MTQPDPPLPSMPNVSEPQPPRTRREEDARGDENRWVALIGLGDRQAFSEMFHEYAERLADYAYSIVASGEAAEEIVQEVFLSIWQRREQWQVRGTLKQYLYGSVRNRALDVLKRQRARHRF